MELKKDSEAFSYLWQEWKSEKELGLILIYI